MGKVKGPIVSDKKPSGQTSRVGRPLYENPDGSYYSEVTVTFPFEGKWLTFPSVDESGNILSEDEVFEYVKKNGPVDPITGETFPVFETLEDAESFARDRSKGLIDFNEGGLVSEDKTLEAFGMTREEMEQANQQAADQMLPMPYDIPGEVGPSETAKSKLNLSQFIPPNLRQPLSEASALGYQVADNVIGIDDDYDTSGELLARALQEDPVNTIKSVATGVVDSVKAAYDDPRGALSSLGNEFASAYEMLSTPMDPNASRDEVGRRLEAATLLSAVVPGAQLVAGGARAATSAGARAIPSMLDAVPEYDIGRVSPSGIRNRSENNPLANKETFSGDLDSLHGYGSWFVGAENPQKTSFVPKESYAEARYDTSGGTFGSGGVYLERIDDREFSDPSAPILTYPNYMLAKVPFKNAFVVNPSTASKLREYLDSVGYGGDKFFKSDLSDDLIKKLESEGHDGIIVTGFQ